MTRRRLVGAAVIAAALAMLVWTLWPQVPRTLIAARAPQHLDGTRAADTATGRTATASTADTRGDPDALPSLRVPLRQALPALQAQAARGDATARCRLYTEYAYCASQRGDVKDLLRNAELREGRLAAATTQRQRDDELRGLRAIEESLQMAEIGSGAQHCRDVAIPDAAGRWRLLRAAALAGNLAATRLYVRGIESGGLLRRIDQLRDYRAVALDLATRAAAAGDLESLFRLANAYDPDPHIGGRTPLSEVTGTDARRALSYYLQLQRLYADTARPDAEDANELIGDAIASLSPRLSADEIAAARAAAEQRLAQWRAPPPDTRVQVSGVTSSPNPNTDREACAPHGEYVGGEIFVERPDGTLVAPPHQDGIEP